jgi:hypothetical protein
MTAEYYNVINYDTFITLGSEVTGNVLPVISNPVPANASTGQLRPPTLSIDVTDADADTFNLTWYSNSSGSWQPFAYNRSVTDGTFYQTNSNFSTSNTTYWWNVSVDDQSDTNDSGIYHFTTLEGVDKPTLFAGSRNDDTNDINLTWTVGTNSTHTRIQRKSGSAPTTISDGTNVYNSTGASYTDTSSSDGVDYYYSAWAYNSTLNEWSSSYESVEVKTRPIVSTSLSVTTVSNNSVSISWTKGSGADNTAIRYGTTYPTSITDGTQAYNSTGTSYTLTGLSTSTTYYFRAWSWNTTVGLSSWYYENATATTYWNPSNTSNLIAGIYDYDQINLSWTNGNGTASVVCRQTGSYPANYDTGTKVYNGSSNSYADTGLTASTQYYYRVWSWNNTIGLYSTGYAEAYNYTRPQQPQNVTGIGFNSSCVNFSWDIAEGTDNYTIIRNSTRYPINVSDGTQICNTTLTYFNDTSYTSGDYYSIFSFNETSGLFSLVLNVEWGGLVVYVYNESTGLAIPSWGIYVTNQSGSESYEDETNTNGASFNIGTLPNGAKTAVIINATGYESRTYYMDIYPNNVYVLNAYLLAETSATLYLLSVVNEYDSPVSSAKMIVKRAVSGSFVNISILYTDSSGQVDIFLEAGKLYKFEISKTNYITNSSDYIPSSSIQTHEFTLETEGIGPVIQPDSEIVTFSISRTGTTLTITYNDINTDTINTTVYIYGVNASNQTKYFLMSFTNTSIDSFTHSITVNSDDDIIAVLYFNTSTFTGRSRTITITGLKGVISGHSFDTLITAIIGSNPFGWGNFLIFLFLVAGCYYSDGKHAGEIMILLGGLFLFINGILGFNATFQTVAGGIIPALFILVGLITMWAEKHKKVI